MTVDNLPPPRILFVTAHCPLGPVYGAQLRTLNLARILAKSGELDLAIFPFGPIPEDVMAKTCAEFRVRGVFHLDQASGRSFPEKLRREIDPYCADTEGKCLSSAEQERFDRLIDDYDVIWFQGIAIPNCLGRRRWPNAVLDIDDVPSQCFAGKAREAVDLPSRFKAIRKSAQWKRREKVFLKRFGILGVCSDQDRRCFDDDERVHVIPNGFEAPALVPVRSPAAPPRVGFIGTLRYAPNLDGMRWFIQQVWPNVLEAQPDARLRLIGSGTGDGIAAEGGNIDGLGFVEDSESEIASWSLTIVPILVGGGTRIKIAEAFGRKCPVVSTTQGAYGYTVTDGDECFLKDNPAAFAQACLILMTDQALGDAMADRARAKFERELDWKAIEPRVRNALQACLEMRRNETRPPVPTI